jgi:tetratricopeptide (TPR) repeat protein
MGFLRNFLLWLGIGKVTYELDQAEKDLAAGQSEKALSRCITLEQEAARKPSLAKQLTSENKARLSLIKARALTNLSRLDEAKRCYQEALQYKHADVAILSELSLLYASHDQLRFICLQREKADKDSQETFKKLLAYLYFSAGVDLLQLEMFSEALNAFRIAVSFDPQNCIYSLAETIAYCWMGDYDSAHRVLNSLANASDDMVEAMHAYLRGFLHAKHDELREASRDFISAFDKYSRSLNLLWNLAAIKLAQGQFDGIRELVRQFLRLVVEREHRYQGKAVILANALEAVQSNDFTLLLERLSDPSHPGFLHFLNAFWLACLRLINEYKFDEVISILNKLFEQTKQLSLINQEEVILIYKELKNLYAYCLAFTGRWNEAQKILNELNDNPLLLHNKAIVALRVEPPDKAIVIWENLVKLWEEEYNKDKTEYMRYYLIECYLIFIDILIEIKQWGKITEICDKILRLDKNNIQALIYKRDALMAQERYNDALKISEYLMKIDPDEMSHKFSHFYILTSAKNFDAGLDWLISLKKKYPGRASERFNEIAREICRLIVKAHGDWINAANMLLNQIARIIAQRAVMWNVGVNWEKVNEIRNQLVSDAEKMRRHIKKAKEIVSNPELLSIMDEIEEDIQRTIQELDDRLSNLRRIGF